MLSADLAKSRCELCVAELPDGKLDHFRWDRLIGRSKRCRPSVGPAFRSVVSDFKTLRVWQKAHALALNAHRIAMRLPGSHNSALRSQVIRAAMSIPTNVVEGTGQRSAREYARFVSIAVNSASELEYHLMIARDLGAISVKEFDSLSSETLEVRKMLYGLLRALKNSPARKVESAQADS